MRTIETPGTGGPTVGRFRAAVRPLDLAGGRAFVVDLATFGAPARDVWLVRRTDDGVELTRHSDDSWSEPPKDDARDQGAARPCAGDDPVLQALGAALLPALERGVDATHAFVTHLLRALGAHLARSESDPGLPAPRLAAWQLRRVQAHVDARVGTAISVSDLAAVCDLSRSHFTRAFKNTTGETPRHWLTTCRLRRAQALLRGPAAIAEIAADCGFADQSHLTRTFARALGTTPGEFRRRIAHGPCATR